LDRIYLQGGIKAVMWTDTFQTIVMFGSFLAVIIKGNNDIGGARRVWDTSYQKNRIEFFK
jgi:Na+/proline symporter